MAANARELNRFCNFYPNEFEVVFVDCKAWWEYGISYVDGAGGIHNEYYGYILDAEIREWLEYNCPSAKYKLIQPEYIVFDNEEEYILFVLRWCN
mgnify:CR=1 FL=1